jgi:hypothetical protein
VAAGRRVSRRRSIVAQDGRQERFNGVPDNSDFVK